MGIIRDISLVKNQSGIRPFTGHACLYRSTSSPVSCWKQTDVGRTGCRDGGTGDYGSPGSPKVAMTQLAQVDRFCLLRKGIPVAPTRRSIRETIEGIASRCVLR